jgi:hypothetical protein
VALSNSASFLFAAIESTREAFRDFEAPRNDWRGGMAADPFETKDDDRPYCFS